MAILANLRNTVLLSLLLAIVMIAAYAAHSPAGFGDTVFWQAVFRWMHVVFGIMWIGLLYYFNFVQIPVMPNVPAELKPAVSKHIAPRALFWFRWSALATVILGLLVAETQQAGYAGRALTLSEGYRTIGIGIWLGLIMAANVWFIIWPNQKRALGLVAADDAVKARSATTAMMASRTNFILSVPMLYCMVAQAHIG